MDDSFHEFEAELKSLQLQRPSARLLESLSADLSTGEGSVASTPPARPRYTTSTNLSSWKWLGWRAAGLAAVFAVFAGIGLLSFKRQPPAVIAAPPAPLAAVDPGVAQPELAGGAVHDRYQPVAASNVLYDLKDEGLVKADNDTEARRVRYRYLDTYTWKNPKSNASIKWSVPRDEIRLVSATLN